MILQPLGITYMQKMCFPFYVTLLAKKILSAFICAINNGYKFNVSQKVYSNIQYTFENIYTSHLQSFM